MPAEAGKLVVGPVGNPGTAVGLESVSWCFQRFVRSHARPTVSLVVLALSIDVAVATLSIL